MPAEKKERRTLAHVASVHPVVREAEAMADEMLRRETAEMKAALAPWPQTSPRIKEAHAIIDRLASRRFFGVSPAQAKYLKQIVIEKYERGALPAPQRLVDSLRKNYAQEWKNSIAGREAVLALREKIRRAGDAVTSYRSSTYARRVDLVPYASFLFEHGEAEDLADALDKAMKKAEHLTERKGISGLKRHVFGGVHKEEFWFD